MQQQRPKRPAKIIDQVLIPRPNIQGTHHLRPRAQPPHAPNVPKRRSKLPYGPEHERVAPRNDEPDRVPIDDQPHRPAPAIEEVIQPNRLHLPAPTPHREHRPTGPIVHTRVPDDV